MKVKVKSNYDKNSITKAMVLIAKILSLFSLALATIYMVLISLPSVININETYQIITSDILYANPMINTLLVLILFIISAKVVRISPALYNTNFYLVYISLSLQVILCIYFSNFLDLKLFTFDGLPYSLVVAISLILLYKFNPSSFNWTPLLYSLNILYMSMWLIPYTSLYSYKIFYNVIGPTSMFFILGFICLLSFLLSASARSLDMRSIYTFVSCCIFLPALLIVGKTQVLEFFILHFSIIYTISIALSYVYNKMFALRKDHDRDINIISLIVVFLVVLVYFFHAHLCNLDDNFVDINKKQSWLYSANFKFITFLTHSALLQFSSFASELIHSFEHPALELDDGIPRQTFPETLKPLETLMNLKNETFLDALKKGGRSSIRGPATQSYNGLTNNAARTFWQTYSSSPKGDNSRIITLTPRLMPRREFNEIRQNNQEPLLLRFHKKATVVNSAGERSTSERQPTSKGVLNNRGIGGHYMSVMATTLTTYFGSPFTKSDDVPVEDVVLGKDTPLENEVRNSSTGTAETVKTDNPLPFATDESLPSRLQNISPVVLAVLREDVGTRAGNDPQKEVKNKDSYIEFADNAKQQKWRDCEKDFQSAMTDVADLNTSPDGFLTVADVEYFNESDSVEDPANAKPKTTNSNIKEPK